MILSDRDLRALLQSGRLVIEPLHPDAVQPSSIDLRVGHQFRVFANNRYPYIDVRQPMDGLTELVEATEEEPFILHPGEFVLGTTLESVTLPDDMVARLEGKSSMGRLGLLIHSSLPGSEPVLLLEDGQLRPRPIEEIVRKRIEGRVVAFDPDTFEVGYHDITGWYEGPPDRIFEVMLASGRRVRVTGGHNLFTLDRSGHLARVRTHELQPGVRVAIARRIPDPPPYPPRLRLLDLAPESVYPKLIVQGPTIAEAFTQLGKEVRALLRAAGVRHTEHYAARGRLPFTVAMQLAGLVDSLGAGDEVSLRGSARGLPLVIDVDVELAWLLGLYVAEGSRRRQQVVVSTTDQDLLGRAQRVLARLGLPVSRSSGAVTCCSVLLSHVFDWLDAGPSADHQRIPPVVFGWPQPLLAAFFEGFVDGDGSREETRTSRWTSSEQLVGDWLLLAAREHKLPTPPAASPLPSRLVNRDLAWDAVVEVRDTGTVESVYDLEVRPDGRKIENFLAGHGGVMVSNTAGFVDAGWSGHLTLELSNVANLPITIYPGMKIGQLALFQMSSPAENPYGSPSLRSKYQGQEGPTPSRYFENFPDR